MALRQSTYLIAAQESWINNLAPWESKTPLPLQFCCWAARSEKLPMCNASTLARPDFIMVGVNNQRKGRFTNNLCVLNPTVGLDRAIIHISRCAQSLCPAHVFTILLNETRWKRCTRWLPVKR